MKKIMLFSFFCMTMLVISCKTSQEKKTNLIKAIEGDELVFDDGRKEKIPGLNDSKVTTIFLVRHAEKIDNSDESDLTPEGHLRAEKLARLMKPVPLAYVGTTKYKRVLNTVGPAATEQAAPFLTYTPQTLNPFLINLLKREKGNNILIGGHSNTVPECLNILTGSKKYKDIPHETYDRIYLAQVNTIGDATVQELRF